MAHLSLIYHIVWRTKYSRRTINEEYERDLYYYILGICREKKCHLYRINSMPDHVHMCIAIHSSVSVSDFVKIVKQESSKWMKEQRDKYPWFEGWGNGYACFTYSSKERPAVIDYIKGQKEHHKHINFRDEFDAWLKEMGEDPENDLFFKD